MEIPGKKLEKIEFKTRPKIKEHMLIVVDKSIDEDCLSQPLQTNNKRFKIAITFLTGYNGIFNVSNSNGNFYFTKSINADGFGVISIPPGAYELQSLNDELK